MEGGKRQYIGDSFILAADRRFCPSEVYFHSDDAPLRVDMEMVENDETNGSRQFNDDGDISSDCTHINIKVE